LGLTALAVLLGLPTVLSGYAVTIFVLIFFYAFLAQAWNIVGGYAGQLSAGHAAFVGVGGYTAALLLQRGIAPWLGIFVGAGVAALRHLPDRDPRGRGRLRGARRPHLQVQDAGDGGVRVPDRPRRHVLRVLPLLAATQHGLRHPAVGRDHHPGGHRRRRHVAG